MKRVLIATCTALLVACGGGGGGGGSNNPPPPNASVGGIWFGTLPDGTGVLGLIAETGEFHFLTEDEIQYFGTLSVSQTGVNGSFTGLAPLGFTFDDGSVRGTGTLTGTIQERVRMPS